MNKRALMLTAATAALMTGPAYAACPTTPPTWTTISTKVTANVDTACAAANSPGSITITTSGSVVISTSPFTTPAVTIDSSNTVTNTGTISYTGVADAVGVEMMAAGNTGGFDNVDLGNVNLTGTGTDKVGILIGLPTGSTTGTFTGAVTPVTAITFPSSFFSTDPIAIVLESGSTVEVAGTTSFGIEAVAGTTTVGDIDIGGAITMTPTSTTSTTSDGNYGVYLNGQLNGNLIILPGGSVTSTGAGSVGIAIAAPTAGTGGINGSLANYGSVSAIGTSAPSTASNASNPEGGSALYVAANITGGILNAGKSSSGDTTVNASFTSEGTGPAVDITTELPDAVSAGPVTIGKYADTNDPDYAGGYSFINRGTISDSPEQSNVPTVTGMSITGSSMAVPLTFVGGLFNSGTITANTSNNDSGSANEATGLYIGNFASIPNLYTSVSESGAGVISATVTGPFGGSAIALQIGTNGSLPVINNYGTISASASTTILTINNLRATAIADQSGENPTDTASGTITTINNYGTILARATTVDANTQIERAVDLTGSTQNVTISNYGNMTGDIVFGTGQNTLLDENLGGQSASVTGNIFFGGNTASDSITVGQGGTLTGSIFEEGQGTVNIDVQAGGALYVENSTLVNQEVAAPLVANDFKIEHGATFTMLVSEPFNLNGTNASGLSNAGVGAIIPAQTVEIADLAAKAFNVTFGSFVASPGTNTVSFDLISTPNKAGAFTVSSTELETMQADVADAIPYLFQSSSGLCTQNIAGSPIACATTTATDSELDLVLVPKLPGVPVASGGLGLTGYALKLFPYANAALATDSTLGAGVVAAVTGQPSAQAVYSSFAPDVSGADRATAIALTDSATDVVAARQRELRMYANQEGDTTLWGQEFAQKLGQDDTVGTIGFNDTGFGFALGMDSGDPSDGRYGGAFTFFSGRESTKEPVDAKTASEYYLGTFYTDWRGKGFFLDTQWTAGWGNLAGKRYIDVGGVDRTADSNKPTEMLAGGATTGVIFNFGGTVVTPQLSVDGLTMRDEGYTESNGGNLNGGDGFDLRVQPYYASSARTFLGVDLREDINFGDFYLQPEARAGYRYDFIDGAVKLKANFVGVTPIDQFSIEGPDPAKGNIVVGGGLAVTTGAWSIGVAYDYLRANSGNTQQDGMLTLLGRI